MFRKLLMATVIACLPIAALAQVSDDAATGDARPAPRAIPKRKSPYCWTVSRVRKADRLRIPITATWPILKSAGIRSRPRLNNWCFRLPRGLKFT